MKWQRTGDDSCHTSWMILRPAEPADALAVARVHVRSWQAAYRGLLPDAYLDQLRPEDRAEQYDFSNLYPSKPRTMVAVERKSIQGFVTTASSREPDLADYGELSALYVDPDQWGRGIGVGLVSAARTRLISVGYRNAFLWVLVGNARAERFYRSDGWARDGVRRTGLVWGVSVDEVRFRRRLAD